SAMHSPYVQRNNRLITSLDSDGGRCLYMRVKRFTWVRGKAMTAESSQTITPWKPTHRYRCLPDTWESDTASRPGPASLIRNSHDIGAAGSAGSGSSFRLAPAM